MYEPQNTTVVNKTIVYSDEVLPLKDLENNLKVTSISNVEVYALDDCLKAIFESNPNVVFNTVQYSKSERRVYFYTENEISKKAWNDRTSSSRNSKAITYEPLISSSEILEEVKRILLAEKNKDEDCISLYDLAQLMKKKNNQYEEMIRSYESYLNKVYDTGIIRVFDFKYKRSELSIGLRGKPGNPYERIVFTKKNGDLFIKESETTEGKDILVSLGGILSKLYDEFIEYKDFKSQYNYSFKSINSHFLIDIREYKYTEKYKVSIFCQSNKDEKDFELSSCICKELYSHTYGIKWSYDCNSNKVISAFKGKESEIFKRILVKISDCPEWSQPILYSIRKNQLAEEQRIEEEQRYIEKKKQKKLELKRKIFPFLKK